MQHCQQFTEIKHTQDYAIGYIHGYGDGYIKSSNT